MRRGITRRRMLGRLARTSAGLVALAVVPVLASGRRRVERIGLAGTTVRIRVRPLRLDAIGEGRSLAG
ncbi:MAG: hypothetical protein JRG91_12350 [Deltaproteobacteria bacterium]|nr:hypothetical protein [Deltaproteobacteria bacterium]